MILGRLYAFLDERLEPLVATYFRRALLLKLLVFYVAHHVGAERSAMHLLTAALLVAATVAGFSERFARAGIAVWFLYTLGDAALDFPWTPNHHYLETILLGSLLAFDNRTEQRGGRVCAAAILIAFFFAGVQKVYQGHWMNGEYLAHTILFAPPGNGLAYALRGALSAVARVTGLAPLPPPVAASFDLGVEPIVMPTWASAVVLALSRVTVGTEVLVPMLACIARTRVAALLTLLVMQAVFAGWAGIWSFGVTGNACLLLFFPRQARWTYPLLMVVTVILGAVGAAASLGTFLPFDWF